MAPKAPEGEEGKEVEMVPAAPNPEQQLERDVTAHQDSEEEKETAAKIKELLSELQQLGEMISQLLGPAGPHRVVTGDRGQRCLVLMETELSIIAALLTTLSPQHFDDAETKKWLGESWFIVPHLADRVLCEVDPSRHTLLRRASQCFQRRKSFSYWHPFFTVLMLYYTIEHPSSSRYWHLLLPSSDLITPQLAKEHQRFAIYCKERVPGLTEQALSSAFNDFPNDYLRLLLIYMSMFPYGYKFEKDRLILKWIDEGLIILTDFHYGRYSFDVIKLEAERLFSELVDSNVITCVASNCKHKQGEAEACQWQINHFMHQFLASKSAEMGFVFTTTTLNLLAESAAATTTECGNQTSSRMPRRLALHHPDPLLPSMLETMDLSQTRSLAVSGTVCGIPLDKFINLVVLDLEGWENLQDENLLQICRSKMIFLRYLSVRNTRVSKLPHEIKELWALHTSDISYTQISELPLELFQLKGLWYLDLRGTRISQLTKQIEGLRGSMVYLLVGGKGAINSVETAARVPNDVRHLCNLQTLVTVDFTEQPPSFIRALRDLQRLKVLAFTWSFQQSTDRDYCNALLSSIENWKKLQSLTIHCGLGCSMEFLGSLEESGAPRRLEKFKVTAGRFASVPPWIDGLEHLAFVQITVCNKQTTTDDLKILGGLPKLQCLIIGLDFIPGQAIVIGNEGFRELQRFSIYCPMPWLTFNTGAMWKLTYLQLKFCSTPASQICVPSGISNLGRLTEVSLCYNAPYINSPSIKMTVDAVTKKVARHRNPIDLFINGIKQDDVQEVDDEVTQNAIATSSRTNAGAEDDAQAVGEEATAAIQWEITGAKSGSN